MKSSVARVTVLVTSALLLVMGTYVLAVHVLWPPGPIAPGTGSFPPDPVHGVSLPAAVALRLDVIAGATLVLIGVVSLLFGSRFGSVRGRALTALLALAGAYLLIAHAFWPTEPCRTLHASLCQPGSVIANPVAVWWLDRAVGAVVLLNGIVALRFWPGEPTRNG
jgi:hypothetical protein